jgi:hypothetical protein
MYTYQDFVKNKNAGLGDFLLKVVQDYKGSETYRNAEIAEQYDRRRNVTIMKFKKYLYTLTGQRIEDIISPNHRLSSNFFHRLTTQLVQYLLGNGVTFAEKGVKEKLGETFDTELQKAAKYAQNGGVSYGFWNYNKMSVFKATEFAPLKDEENGRLRVGVRFWQLATDKPLRMTLFEEDGYTEYIKYSGEKVQEYRPKRPYKLIVKSTQADGSEIHDGENYPSFPIVPLYANDYHQSEIVGLRENIDAYDLIKSGFANDLDGNLFYWLIKNAGGMGDEDIARMLERIKTLGAAIVNSDEGGGVDGKEIKIPFEARNTYLARIEEDLYNDFGALKVEKISGHTTIPEIEAAYTPLDSHADEFEYFCIVFVQQILELQGVKATPQFKRNRISNRAEETAMILQSASYLDDETILKKLPFLTPDEIEPILRAKRKEEAERYTLGGAAPEDADENEGEVEEDEETKPSNNGRRKEKNG